MPVTTTLKKTLMRDMAPSYKKAIVKKIHLSLSCEKGLAKKTRDLEVGDLSIDRVYAILGHALVRQRLLDEALELIQRQSKYSFLKVVPKELIEMKENCAKVTNLGLSMAKALLYKEHEDETALLVSQPPDTDTARPGEPASAET